MNCLQLDIARQKESLTFIKSYFSKAKEWGYDTIILYLENCVKTSVTANFSPDEVYEQYEIKEIVEYAETLGLDVIPALENLGHLEKFFAYLEWRKVAECEDEQKDGRGFDPEPYGSCGCPSNPKLYDLTDTYIKEVVALFKSEYVHAGLDEVFDMGVCEKCRSRIEKGESKRDIFLKHVLHTYDLIKSLGKTMMMWDDFFEYVDIVNDLPRDIILCNWNYGYIDYEPRGHWTGRIKKDWFALYDELGFKYLYCVYAHRASSLYNIKSFYNYAAKRNPAGAICTAWCRQDSFYLGAYPFMAYCGKLWSAGSLSEAELAYEKEIGDKELAVLISSLNVVDTGRNENITAVAECRYLSLESYESVLKYALKKIKENPTEKNEKRDIISDIYGYISEIYCGLILNRLANKVFDCYETGKNTDGYVTDLDEIADEYKRIYENKLRLWEIYRKGVKSEGNALENKYTGILSRLAKQREVLIGNPRSGILTLEQMQFDAFGTPKCEIILGYNGGEEVVCDGALKPSTVAFEQSGCYYHRFAIKNERPEYVILSFYGESASYPQYISLTVGGKKYIPSAIEKISGEITNEDNLLENDTRFASFGCGDGVKHFNDISLAKKKRTVKITFKEFING